MKESFKIWRTSRSLIIDILNNHTIEQLNNTPKGFKNNLIWNAGHIVVAQQSLVYKCSELPMYISEEMVSKYKPGTIPSGNAIQKEIDEVRHLLTSLIEKTEKDFAEDRFTIFNERTTGTGFHLASLKDAIQFNNYHEGLHLGFMMNIRKFI